MAPGLDIGDAPERSAEPGSDRPGRDDRHVSLDEDVIDERGHGVGHCGSSLRLAVLRGFCDEHAGSCAERAPDHHSEEQALRERRCDDLLPELARAPRLAVVEDRRDARRVDHGAGRSLGQQGQHPEPQPDHRLAVEFIRENVRAVGREPREPGHRQPGDSERRPLVWGCRVDPEIEGIGRRPDRPLLLIIGEEAGRVREFDGERCGRRVTAEHANGTREITDSEPAAAQHARRLG